MARRPAALIAATYCSDEAGTPAGVFNAANLVAGSRVAPRSPRITASSTRLTSLKWCCMATIRAGSDGSEADRCATTGAPDPIHATASVRMRIRLVTALMTLITKQASYPSEQPQTVEYWSFLALPSGPSTPVKSRGCLGDFLCDIPMARWPDGPMAR